MSLHRSAWGYCTRFGEEGNWGIGRRGFDAEERRGEERRGEERRGGTQEGTIYRAPTRGRGEKPAALKAQGAATARGQTAAAVSRGSRLRRILCPRRSGRRGRNRRRRGPWR